MLRWGMKYFSELDIVVKESVDMIEIFWVHIGLQLRVAGADRVPTSAH